jgi:hypothetical protein
MCIRYKLQNINQKPNKIENQTVPTKTKPSPMDDICDSIIGGAEGKPRPNSLTVTIILYAIIANEKANKYRNPWLKNK